MFARPQSLIFPSVGTLKRTECIQLRLNTKGHFIKALLKPVKPFTTVPGLLKVWDNPRLAVSMRALINPLKTKLKLLYLKTQFVPRSKHFSSRL